MIVHIKFYSNGNLMALCLHSFTNDIKTKSLISHSITQKPNETEYSADNKYKLDVAFDNDCDCDWNAMQ